MAKYYLENDSQQSYHTDRPDELGYMMEEFSANKIIVEGDFDVKHQEILAHFNLPVHFMGIRMKKMALSTIFSRQIFFKGCVIENLDLNNQHRVTIEDSEILEFNYTGDTRYLSFLRTNIDKFVSRSSIISLRIELLNCKVKHIIFQQSAVSIFKIEGTILSEFEILSSTIEELHIECLTFETFVIIESKINKFTFNRSNSISSKINLYGSTFETEISFTNLKTINLSFYQSIFTEQFKNFTFNDFFGDIFFNECSFLFPFRIYDNRFIDNHPKLTFSNSIFEKPAIFYDEQSKNMVLENVIFQQGVLIPLSPITENPTSVHSSVWCALKHNALQSNNRILAMEYGKLEMNSYKKELKSTKGKSSDKFVLFLNNLSNKHGLDWIRGAGFTLITALIFYSIFYIGENLDRLSFSNASISGFKEFVIGLFQFIWLLEGISDLPEKLRSNNLISFFLMLSSFLLGKIAVAYGIYQTVAAFRKHGKI